MRKILKKKTKYLLSSIIISTILFSGMTLKNNLITKDVKIYNNSNMFEVKAENTQNNYIYLSDYDWVSAKNGYNGSVQKDQGQGGSYKLSLMVDGVKREFKKGFSVHANGYVTYDISKFSTEYTRFIAQVGVDNSQGSKGSVQYTIFLSNDNQNWESKLETGTLTGGKNAYNIDVDITGYKYIRIYVGNAGNGNGNDHGTIGEAKLVRKGVDPTIGFYDKLRTVEYYDNILKNNSLEDNYNKNYNLVLKREIVKKLGYWNIQDLSEDNEKVAKLLNWLLENDTRLEQVIEVGAISNSNKFLTTLADLYEEYKSCLTAENGDVYQKMMIGLAAGYSSDRASSPLTFSHITPSYDYIERFSIIKKLYDDDLFLYGKGFKEYHIEFFRYIMHDATRNDELRWMNFCRKS